jgi:hypothetical protein
MATPLATDTPATGTTTDLPDADIGGCGGFGARERAFEYTAPTYGTYTFSTEGADFDTVLYVRDGDCFGNELACNDEAGAATHASATSLALRAGQRVIAFVDGFGGAAGTFSLRVTRTDLPACPETDLGSAVIVSTVGSPVGGAKRASGRM